MDKGVDNVAEQAGQDVTVGLYKLIKKSLKIFVYGTGATTAVATPVAMLFPKTFEWLKPVLTVLLGI